MNALELLKKERVRQITDEGWTPEHDQKLNYQGNLVRAAACYLDWDRQNGVEPMTMPTIWPWEKHWWKPTAQNGQEGITRELIRGGALLMAEYDRFCAQHGIPGDSVNDIDGVTATPDKARNFQFFAQDIIKKYLDEPDDTTRDPKKLLEAAVLIAKTIENNS